LFVLQVVQINKQRTSFVPHSLLQGDKGQSAERKESWQEVRAYNKICFVLHHENHVCFVAKD